MRRHPSLVEIGHRPWPLPRRRPLMAMSWHRLLFAHWQVDAEVFAGQIPKGLELDTFEGAAWLGVVPFIMRGVRPLGLPPLPWVSAFAEINVRTYVTAGGKAGVWFFSLDAANPLAVRAARWSFHLPYFDARMASRLEGGWTRYRSRRTHRGAPPAVFSGRYRPRGAPRPAPAGSLDHWLTERYCLYAGDARGRLFRGEIHHRAWPLQEAEVEIEEESMGALLGLPSLGAPVHLRYAEDLDVLAWAPEPLAGTPPDRP